MSSISMPRTLRDRSGNPANRSSLLVGALLGLLWGVGCSSDSKDDEGTAGDTSTAAQSQGATSSLMTGGTSNGGSPSNGGTSPGFGGAVRGGAPSGGTSSGGSGVGGSSGGGLAIGGSGLGGANNGGAPLGGASSGGLANGGAALGGASSGGLANGGAAFGGANGGGTSDGGVAPVGGSGLGGAADGGTQAGGSGPDVGGSNPGGSESGGAEQGGAANGGSGDGGSSGSTETGGAASTVSPGCSAADHLESGTHTIDVSGTERKYIIDVPSSYESDHPYPLIFVWHPLTGSAQQVVDGDYNGLKSRSNETAILVSGDGLTGGSGSVSGQGWWNDGGGDMEFLGLMLEEFFDNLCIDQSRIFSTGFSHGGMMSYAIGFEYGDVFRAIAPASGNLQGTPHQQITDNALAMFALHGDGDGFVSTEGGRAARDAYLARNHCTEQTVAVDPSPCVQYQDCDVPTFWCEFPGEHNPWSQAPDAIWDFFSSF